MISIVFRLITPLFYPFFCSSTVFFIFLPKADTVSISDIVPVPKGLNDVFPVTVLYSFGLALNDILPSPVFISICTSLSFEAFILQDRIFPEITSFHFSGFLY